MHEPLISLKNISDFDKCYQLPSTKGLPTIVISILNKITITIAKNYIITNNTWE
jgi:hypothetical protein